MLVNYLVIFVLLVFNEFYSIGTILYTLVNTAFLVYLTIISYDVIKKLRNFQSVAINNRYPQNAVNMKLSLMKKSTVLIIAFFGLEIFYHGVLGIFGIPNSHVTETYLYSVHEITDFVIISLLMFTLRTREYIPYYGVINVDSEQADEDVEFQRINDAVTLTVNLDSTRYM
jgi:hypothetical protein